MSLHEDLEYILNPNPVAILINVRREQETIPTQIAKDVDATQAHASKITSKLEEMGLMNKTDTDGTKTIVEPTEKGEDIADLFMQIDNKLKGLEL